MQQASAVLTASCLLSGKPCQPLASSNPRPLLKTISRQAKLTAMRSLKGHIGRVLGSSLLYMELMWLDLCAMLTSRWAGIVSRSSQLLITATHRHYHIQQHELTSSWLPGVEPPSFEHTSEQNARGQGMRASRGQHTLPLFRHVEEHLCLVCICLSAGTVVQKFLCSHSLLQGTNNLSGPFSATVFLQAHRGL